MPRSSATTLALPPFEGTVRRLILANVVVFFAFEIMGWLTPGLAGSLLDLLQLQPFAVAHGALWQLFTYSFLNLSLLGILFGMLTLWFVGPMLEGIYGSRWLAELYFTSAIGGAAIASAISFTHVLHLSQLVWAAGVGAPIFGLLIAIAVRLGDQEFLLWFTVRIKAKYLVGVYVLIDLAMLLKDSDQFNALLQLSGGVCGYLYVRFAPSRGFAFGASEQYFGLRNAFYRARRRRAARKFEVYMGKQGRKVTFDKDGRYLDPDNLRNDPGARKDPSDKRWMN
jgi:membrane associated rhomboid family serine protease